MKRIILTIALIAGFTGAAKAQFTAGTKYIGASVSGLSMSYSKSAEFNLGLNADAGYYFADGWMVRGNFGYNHAKTLDGLTIGAGVRYSFLQNGVFLGVGLEYGFDKYTNTTSTLVQTINNDRTYYVDPALGIEALPDPIVNTTIDEHVRNVTRTERTNNLRIPVEIGYTFYLNHYLAIEPAIYSKMSLNHFSEGTEFGLKIGFGFYFDRFHNVQRQYRPRYNF